VIPDYAKEMLRSTDQAALTNSLKPAISRKRRTAMVKIVVFVALLMAVAGCGGCQNLLLVENNSGTACTSVTVAVCDSSWTFNNLYPGEEQEVSVVYTKDDSFHVTVQFAGGGTLSGSFGYVTHGITGERIRITIQEDSIAFLQSRN